MPSRARSLKRPPGCTAVTVPSSLAPAGIAVRPSTVTSRVTRALTRSSTFAVSLDTLCSRRMPITESSLTVSSSKRGAGGGGLTGAASTAVVVETGAGSVALEAGDGDGHCAGGGAGCADVSVLGSDADPYRAGGAGGVCVFADLVVAGVVFAVGAVALGARDAFRLRSTAGSIGTVV